MLSKKLLESFFISDLHFSHKNILTSGFGTRDFETIEEHDEYLIKVWNETVGADDTVYLLGDIAFSSAYHLLARLSGRLIIILGNHDYPSKLKEIQKYAPNAKIGGAIIDGGAVITHIPVHPNQLEYRAKVNIHGHLHDHNIDDPRYINCSVEQLPGYKPTKLKDIMANAKNRG